MSCLITKVAHWADAFSTDALGEILSIICKCRSSQKQQQKTTKISDQLIGMTKVELCNNLQPRMIQLIKVHIFNVSV